MLLALLFSIKSYAHKGAIQGSIKDSTKNQLIIGATVQIKETSQITSTDLLGNYFFNDVHPGNYTIEIKAIGYQSAFVNVQVLEENTTICNVKLNPTGITLNEVTITNSFDQLNLNQKINMLDLDLRPIKSSQDILKMVPGLFIAQHAGGGKAEQIFLRGFDVDHGTDIQITVDGLPVNMVSHAHGQGYADLHFITPELIDNVDFNKGPYYAQHGDFNTAGYVSLKTKNSIDKSFIKSEIGMYNSFRQLAVVDLLGKKKPTQSAYVSAEYMYTNGYFESPQNFNRINLFGKYNGMVDENKMITISLSTFNSKWEASGQIPQRAVDSKVISRFGAIDDKEGGNTSRTNANIELLQALNSKTTIKHQLFFSNYNFELFSNFTFFLQDSVNGDQIKQQEARNIYGYNNSIIHQSNLFGKKVRTIAGMQIRHDATKGSELSHTLNRKTVINRLALGDITQSNIGLYAEQTWCLTNKWTVNFGARVDDFQLEYVNDLDTLYQRKSKNQFIVSPKLSVYYQRNEKLQLYFKTGTGFHSNDTRAVLSDSTSLTTLPRAYGADIGIYIKPTSSTLINLAVWALDLEQEFVYVGDAAVVEPSGYTRRYGIDGSLRCQITPWLFSDVDVNYTIARSVNDSVGKNFIPLAPKFTSIGGLTTKFKNGLSIGLRYRYMADRAANEDNSVIAKGYSLLDGAINFNKSRYSVGLNFENILNSNWNEAQFNTESRLKNEKTSVSEIHFTPGTPLFIKGSFTFLF